MQDSYSATGRCFEYLNKDCGYEQWSQYLIEKLKSLGAGPVGADVGCGNGYFTRALCRAGYDMTGVDVSAEMLSRARILAAEEGINVPFVQGDAVKLKLLKKADFIISVNDCFNYIPPEKLPAAFARAAASLKKGGAFIFDISSRKKLEEVIGDNLFADDSEDYTYLWFNRREGESIIMDVTLFLRGKDGRYTRYDERHVQYMHGKAQTAEMLRAAGFSVQTEGHLGGSEDERINFICKKL